MKSAVVIGSTGLIGKILVEKLAHEGSWAQILAVVRKPVSWSNPKVRNITFDFKNWDSLELQIRPFIGTDSADFFCALGTTIKVAGTEENFKKVDYQAVLDFGQVAKRCWARSFIVVSALGSDANSSNFYLRTKGEMESAVTLLALPQTHFLRPSLLLGDRAEFRLFERLSMLMSPVLSFFLKGPLKKYKPVRAEAVANMMVKLAAKRTTAGIILENEEILEKGT